jgi:hypothetical protein
VHLSQLLPHRQPGRGEDSWLLQELHAMTSVPDFLSDDFLNLESWGII